MIYHFIVEKESGEVEFEAIKPTLEMLEEEIGRYQRLKERSQDEKVGIKR